MERYYKISEHYLRLLLLKEAELEALKAGRVDTWEDYWSARKLSSQRIRR